MKTLRLANLCAQAVLDFHGQRLSEIVESIFVVVIRLLVPAYAVNMMFRVDMDCMEVKMLLLEDYITFILLKYIHNYICLHRETKNQFMNLVLQFCGYLCRGCFQCM
jgi:hypothetical protein